jgi:hypothetical protein
MTNHISMFCAALKRHSSTVLPALMRSARYTASGAGN